MLRGVNSSSHSRTMSEKSEQQPQRRKPIRIAIDKAPGVYRKRIRDLIAEEVTQDLANPELSSFINHD